MVFDRVPSFAIATLVSLSWFFGVVRNILSKVVSQGFRAKWLTSNVYKVCSILARDMRRLIYTACYILI